MSKYIDAEKLIAEIERRKKQDITFRERNILVDIETCIASLRAEMIITSHQQEQPSLPSGLDDAAEEQAHSFGYQKEDYEYKELIETFKAGAEWMARQGQTIESLIWRDEDGNLYIEEYIDKNKFKKADNIIVQVRKKQ